MTRTYEELREVDVGASTADADNVRLSYQSGDLLVRYTDWQERAQEKRFTDVLAFRWQGFDNDAPRDDAAYMVLNSSWLHAQAKAQGVTPESYVHLRICFNTKGMLDVICVPTTFG